ncbi:MAG: class I SAM-dependent methyltransferase [Nitrososphaerota archaeon]|nr:class I SAM-dependent methyltransferase [Nitrososphaerota archaeon]MDG6940419.1 class I SAM-dependent methyltransferase [Nitrososphaerota archaeon]MDG6962382.1 class I SAM-dependent methyltransferase [Nitrososphaerota archaeon]MDG6992635.1 class I SAM-dependent methyltransferase [Nitrososphaerota archaeon]MDG6994254.1 class I SAM-dependent methyltransferase [Nitrososphaerota archaeon]
MRGKLDGYDGWNDLSHWYDRKQGDGGDLWHRALIDPALLKVVRDCRGKTVLDFGCGNGYLSRRLARQDADVIAVDASPKMVESAGAHGSAGVKYLCSDAARLKGIPDGRFDIVFANMSLTDMPDAENAVGEVARVLKGRGIFVAGIYPQCFEVMSHSGWVAEKAGGKLRTVYRKVTGYRKPFSDKMRWDISDGTNAYTMSYHRPLGWYARVSSSKGMAITALDEPQPTKEFVEIKQGDTEDLGGPGLREVPLHLMIEAVKL